MKYKTSELEGALLDAAVAKAEGYLETSDFEDIGNAVAGIGGPVLFKTESGKLGAAGVGISTLTNEWAPSRFWH